MAITLTFGDYIPPPTSAVSVVDVTMALPNIVRVQINDGIITRGAITPYGSSLPDASRGQWGDYFGSRGQPIGQLNDHILMTDVRGAVLDRTDLLNLSGYFGTSLGGRSITAIHHQSMPYQSGANGIGGGKQMTVFRHYLYLVLDGNLPQGGPHTISFPSSTGLADYTFTFNDKRTRACAIKASQHGHRADDVDKRAYLQIWIPGYGTEGQVAFPNGTFPQFQIVDGSETVVYTGNITLRMAPGDGGTVADGGVNPVNGFWANTQDSGWATVQGLCRLISTTIPPLTVAGITRADPGVITYSGTGFTPTENQWVFLYDWFYANPNGGVSPSYGDTYPMQIRNLNTTAKTFNLYEQVQGRMWPTNSAVAPWNAALTPNGPKIFASHQANSAGTYVYEMNFSAATSLPDGNYRIVVPGLGSERIRIRARTHLDTLKTFHAGWYSQRHGTANNGELGYTRPSMFEQGVSEDTIYKSNCPMAFTDYGTAFNSPANSRILMGLATQPPFLTSTIQTVKARSYADAGDWDETLSAHGLNVINLLQLFEEIPADRYPSMRFGLPELTTFLDPTLYAGTGSLPDLLKEIIAYADWYRLSQEVAGGVSSGISYSANYPGAIYNDQASAPGPAWRSFKQIGSMAPDHLGTILYAALAAMLARVMGNLGFTTIASTFQTSAVNAYNWCQAMFTNTSTRDTYYKTTLDLMATGGTTYAQNPDGYYTITPAAWTLAKYDEQVAWIQSTYPNARLMALAALWRLTGTAAYNTLFLSSNSSLGDSWSDNIAAWEYLKAPGGDATTKATYSNNMTAGADNFVLGFTDGTVAYRHLRYRTGRMSFGGGGTDCMYTSMLVWKAHALTGAAKYLNALQAHFGWIHGANQTGMSFTTGIGVRNQRAVLHVNHLAGGGIPLPPGLSTYSVSSPYIFPSYFNMYGRGPLVGVVEYPADTEDYEKIMAPISRLAFPYQEAVFEHPLHVGVMEFTTSQNILPLLGMAAYLVGKSPVVP